MVTQRRVLLVEDEPAIAQIAQLYLERDGYQVIVVGDAQSALHAVRRDRPDVVLLDIGLPGPLNGIDVCRLMRAEDDWTPVIFVTARDDEIDRILGLELGADDYVTKPFSPRELVARVKAVVRRRDHDRAAPADAPVLSVGAVRLDLSSRRAWSGSTPVTLTATEFDLLAALMGRPGRVYSRGELLSRIWDYPADDGTRTVDVHVAQIRAKLGSASPIRTVRGVGYSAEQVTP